jgi:hypothetical protein
MHQRRKREGGTLVRDPTLTKEMFANQKMLGQHGDMSAVWTAKQLEIIREAGLKEK